MRTTGGFAVNAFVRVTAFCFLTCALCAPARADKMADTNAKIVAWANSNLAKYNQYTQYARQKAKPQVPVPPMVDPPCHVCGDTAKTQGEEQVDAWIKQVEEPETSYAKALGDMARQVTMFRALGDQLSPAAEKALSPYEDDKGFMDDIGKLADRLFNGKAFPMAEKHYQEPKMAYAGIRLLAETSRDAALTQGWSSTNSQEQEVIELIKKWVQSITKKIDSDVLSGHQYNLCPVYASLYRQVELLGGPATNMDQYMQTIQKLQDLMKFNVNLNLKVTMNGDDGSHLYATWVGKAKLKLDLDFANSCYTPHWENGGKMAVNVTQWDMLGIEHLSDGEIKRVPATLSSPHQYDATLQAPQLNLCDPQPILQIPLININVPQEMVTAEGHTEPSGFLQPFLASIAGTNEINQSEANELTGGAASMPGSGPSSSGGGDSSSMDQARAQIEAHKGDVGWIMSPEGQVAIANVQKAAFAQVQSRTASAGVVLPKSNNLAQLTSSLQSAHLPWTNGNAEPVNKTLHVTKDAKNMVLTITVDQSSK
jgi:hypothetical protein